MILLSFVWYIKSLAVEGDRAQMLSYRRSHQTEFLRLESPTVILNLFLGVLVIALLAYYVVTTNYVIASEYRFRVLHDRLASVHERSGELAIQQELASSHTALLEFAQSKSMTEARDGIRIVEPGNIAFSR